MTTGFLTTHVLDTARGCPAQGIQIALYRLDAKTRTLVHETTTNADGRTDVPLLPPEHFVLGTYEIVFAVGPYLRQVNEASRLFLDAVPIRFVMSEVAHYHVPLLLSPFGYSTYRGS